MYYCECIEKVSVIDNLISFKMIVTKPKEVNTIHFVYNNSHDTPSVIIGELENDADIRLENIVSCQSGLRLLSHTRMYKIEYEKRTIYSA